MYYITCSRALVPVKKAFADLMLYEHPCSPILPVSYNYPHLIPEETEMTCSKVTLQKQLGLGLQSDEELGAWAVKENC